MGKMEKSFFMAHPREIVVELSVHNDSIITGVSHLYYKGNHYEHHKLNGKFSISDSTVRFTEDSILGVNFHWTWSMCPGKYDLNLISTGGKLMLQGKWSDKTAAIFRCPTVKIWFEKRQDSTDDAAQLADAKPVLKKKNIPDIQQVIELSEIEKDSIRIDLYDNGEIDDDSVTVLYDEQVIIFNQRVSDKALTFYLSLNNEKRMHRLKLIGENQGRIPPNTSLMVITTKKKRYQVYLTSTVTKDAVVEFFFVD